MGVRVKGIRESDGSGTEVVVKDSKEESDSKILSTLVGYNYNSSHSLPPGTGQLRTDNDNVVNVTKIWINRIDQDGRDIKFLLLYQAKVGKQIFVQDVNNSDSRALFSLTTDSIDGGNYITLEVECDITSGTPLAGAGVLLGLLL